MAIVATLLHGHVVNCPLWGGDMSAIYDVYGVWTSHNSKWSKWLILQELPLLPQETKIRDSAMKPVTLKTGVGPYPEASRKKYTW